MPEDPMDSMHPRIRITYQHTSSILPKKRCMHGAFPLHLSLYSAIYPAVPKPKPCQSKLSGVAVWLCHLVVFHIRIPYVLWHTFAHAFNVKPLAESESEYPSQHFQLEYVKSQDVEKEFKW